jgi:hypothetical protein
MYTTRDYQTYLNLLFSSFQGVGVGLPGHIHRPLFPDNGHFYLAGIGHLRLYLLGYFKA